MLRLNAKGFAHWVIPALVVVIVGAIGTYTLTRSHAAALYPTAANCGSGYTKMTIAPYYSANYPAYLSVYYNPSLKRACAFNVATDSANGGATKPMSVQIGVDSTGPPVVPLTSYSGTSSSTGSFTRWAGPVYVNYGPIHTKYPNMSLNITVYGKITYNGKTGTANGSSKITAKMY